MAGNVLYPANGYNFGDEGKFETSYDGYYAENKRANISKMEISFTEAYNNNGLEIGTPLQYRQMLVVDKGPYTITDNSDSETCTVKITPSIAPEDNKYQRGSEITLQIIPKEGYEFDSLLVNGNDVNPVFFKDTFTYTFVITQDTSINAVCILPESHKYNITTEAKGNGKGTVSTDPEKGAEKGQTVTVSLIPDEGFTIESAWVDEVELELDGSGNGEFIMPGRSVTVSGVFGIE